jgi:hypothetical protein
MVAGGGATAALEQLVAVAWCGAWGLSAAQMELRLVG